MSSYLSYLSNFANQILSDSTTGGIFLRAMLIGCSLFACVQLLTMWGTRYGDQNAMSKSFYLSLLLHVCFGLGWATAVHSSGPRMQAYSPERIDVTKLTLKQEGSGTDNASAEGDDQAPHWTRSSSAPAVETSRTERMLTNPDPIERPEIAQSDVDRTAPPEAPELSTRTDDPTVSAPERIAAQNAARAAAQASPSIEQPVTEARPDVTPSTQPIRQSIRREVAILPSEAMKREPRRGSAERSAPFIEDGVVLTLPSEVTPEAVVTKTTGVPGDVVQRRASPDALPLDTSETGSQPSVATNKNPNERRVVSRIPRNDTRNADADFGPSPVRPSRASPSSTPSAELPLVPLKTSPSSEANGELNPTATPQLVRPGAKPLVSVAPARAPETYRGRRLEQRKSIALKNGGSESTERAVEASLKWMSSLQEPDGSWSSAKHGGGLERQDPQGNDRLDGGKFADTGISGLVILSYLGAGYTHDEGKYTMQVRKGLDYLIKTQQENGYLGGKATRYDQMYCHALATFALAEAYGMQQDQDDFPELRDAVKKGVHLICAMQNEDGGWRYGKGKDSDMSMFGWQLMALKSAVNAGIPVPEETRQGMTRFLKARALGTHGGLAGYKLNEPPTPAMTAEALFCRQMFGTSPNSPAAKEAVTYLKQHLPKMTSYDEYYWYYGTLAMFQQDGKEWDEWNASLRDMVVELQRKTGANAGSWDPKGKWAGIGGRLYSTAFSTMSLEVYYRFLRLYQTDQTALPPREKP